MCGANDAFTFEIDQQGHDVTTDEEKYEPAVFIKCSNCDAQFDLSDTIEESGK